MHKLTYEQWKKEKSKQLARRCRGLDNSDDSKFRLLQFLRPLQQQSIDIDHTPTAGKLRLTRQHQPTRRYQHTKPASWKGTTYPRELELEIKNDIIFDCTHPTNRRLGAAAVLRKFGRSSTSTPTQGAPNTRGLRLKTNSAHPTLGGWRFDTNLAFVQINYCKHHRSPDHAAQQIIDSRTRRHP